MQKNKLLSEIIAVLSNDLSVLTAAAKTAHAAATHSECLPDNKYETTALEASYIAQGQANRAQDIRKALDSYRTLTLRPFNDDTPMRLTALITIETDSGSCRRVFLGPDAGGLKLNVDNQEYTVITPESPLGRALLGKVCGDEIKIGTGPAKKIFTIVAVT